MHFRIDPHFDLEQPGNSAIEPSFALHGGGQPPSGIPEPLPATTENLTPEEDDWVWDLYHRLNPSTNQRCANCHRANHTVAQCIIPRPDGYVHGCFFCNTRDHDTCRCRHWPKDGHDRIEILVNKRANMPPLRTKPWYLFLYIYKYFISVTNEDGYPWTTEFGIETLRNTDLGIQAVDAMETGLFFLRPVDPRTRSWEAVKETFGGMPPLFEKYLKRLVFEDKVREMKAWLRGE